MAEKRKSTKTRKPTAGKPKAKAESGVEVLLEDIRDKMGELASEAEVIIKEAGSASKKAAGRAVQETKKTAGSALEGGRKKAGEAAAHLPLVGDGKKAKAAPKRATAAKSSAVKSSTAKSSNGSSKSTTSKKKAATSKPSAAKSSAASKSKKS